MPQPCFICKKPVQPNTPETIMFLGKVCEPGTDYEGVINPVANAPQVMAHSSCFQDFMHENEVAFCKTQVCYFCERLIHKNSVRVLVKLGEQVVGFRNVHQGCNYDAAKE